MTDRTVLEHATGTLFSGLWQPYDDKLFEESVQLYARRLKIAGFDTRFFEGKRCLDAGCGGGRNSIAMKRLGAAAVDGIDIGKQGLEDARRRAAGMENVNFHYSSILDIPFTDETFDLVWCAGVLMITADEDKALDELTRVTKKGGYLYLLVYATEGMRWPLVEWLRPIAAKLGQPAVERAIQAGGLSANKRRTFLDDLFCPKLDFYTWSRLERMLRKRGFIEINRWGDETRLDHEASLRDYREDLESLLAIFAAGDSAEFGEDAALFSLGRRGVEATVDTVQQFEKDVAEGRIDRHSAENLIMGQGHHRVLARRG
jgi:ubiquinone/menaquinone biosynthesis C-methylase UbiE